MQRGEIYLAGFPYGDVAGIKLRPTLLLTGVIGTGTEVLVAYISSVVPTTLLPTDILLDPAKPEGQATGLKVASVLRLHKLATIHRTSIHRYFGRIPSETQRDVDAALKALLKL